MTFRWSMHAVERAMERVGLRQEEIEAAIAAAVGDGSAYAPSERVRRPGERWVPCDGPLGKATAVVLLRGELAEIITIRESETAGQGERASRPLVFNPFRKAFGGGR